MIKFFIIGCPNGKNKKKVSRNIGYLKDADLKSKGVDSGSMTHKDILNELLFRVC